jgi:uncharacterized protein YjiS (DUF1127 family)
VPFIVETTMTRLTADHCLLSEFSPGTCLMTRLSRAATNVVRTVIAWRQRSLGRHQLASMDERLRRDIGVTRADMYLELRKPFWIP